MKLLCIVAVRACRSPCRQYALFAVRRSGAGEEDEEEDDDEGLLELLILVARIPYRLSLSACLLAAASLIIVLSQSSQSLAAKDSYTAVRTFSPALCLNLFSYFHLITNNLGYPKKPEVF